MEKIFVHNSRRVSEFTKIKVGDDDNILLNPEFKDFIDKYSKYFIKPDRKLMEEFFQETGLILGFVYVAKESSRDISSDIFFNSLGCSLSNPFSRNVFDDHLMVYKQIDKIELIDDVLFADGERIYDLRDDSDLESQEYKNKIVRNNLSRLKIETPFDKVPSQVEIIRSEFNPKFDYDEEEVKQVFISCMGRLFVLKNDGTLLCNDKVYDKGVKCLWSKDSFNTMIIFENNRIENIENTFCMHYGVNYDKVICEDVFLATLKGDELRVIRIGEEADSSIAIGLSNVDDFEYDSEKEFIKIFKNKGIIELPIDSIWCEVN